MGHALRNLRVDIIKYRRLLRLRTLVRLDKQGYPEKRGEKCESLLRNLGIEGEKFRSRGGPRWRQGPDNTSNPLQTREEHVGT